MKKSLQPEKTEKGYVLLKTEKELRKSFWNHLFDEPMFWEKDFDPYYGKVIEVSRKKHRWYFEINNKKLKVHSPWMKRFLSIEEVKEEYPEVLL